MDYTPHTDEEVDAMLQAIGVGTIDDLFEAIPPELRLGRQLELGGPLAESEVAARLKEFAARNLDADHTVCFAGGGAYDHYSPAVVRALAGRSEFLTSYTPYQPELSQGVLGALFDYQSMICELTGMEIAGAGLYDGAAALAEAVSLAMSATSRNRIVVTEALNPNYAAVLESLSAGAGFRMDRAPTASGTSIFDGPLDDAACIVLAQPNFFGCVEDMNAAAAAAHKAGALLIVHFDLLSAGLLESPGAQGADVVTAEGQSLGNELNFGGPYLGVFATMLDHQRRMPGRICGRTLDVRGNPGYVLTLQTREQHIRRERATSNVCTDQTLLAIAASVYLSWLGPQGLAELSLSCSALAGYAAELMSGLPGCSLAFPSSFFKEFVLRLPKAAREVQKHMAAGGFLVGPALDAFGMDDCILIAVTEKRTQFEIDSMADELKRILS